MHSIIQTLNFTNHRWKITKNKNWLYVIGVYSTFNEIAYLSYHVQRSHLPDSFSPNNILYFIKCRRNLSQLNRGKTKKIKLDIIKALIEGREEGVQSQILNKNRSK